MRSVPSGSATVSQRPAVTPPNRAGEAALLAVAVAVQVVGPDGATDLTVVVGVGYTGR